jgi:hypothetical protein
MLRRLYVQQRWVISKGPIHLELWLIILHIVAGPQVISRLLIFLILLIQMHAQVLLIRCEFSLPLHNSAAQSAIDSWDVHTCVGWLRCFPWLDVHKLNELVNRIVVGILVKLGPNWYPVLQVVTVTFAQ